MLYDVTTRVPLLFEVPGLSAARIDARRSHIDLARTLADLLGVKAPDSLRGTSLLPELLGAKPQARDVVIDMPYTDQTPRRRALIHGDMKIVVTESETPAALVRPRRGPGRTARPRGRKARAAAGDAAALGRHEREASGLPGGAPGEARVLSPPAPNAAAPNSRRCPFTSPPVGRPRRNERESLQAGRSWVRALGACSGRICAAGGPTHWPPPMPGSPSRSRARDTTTGA